MDTPLRWTTADLDLFPEPLDDTRYEIIDGELYISHQPPWGHQYTTSQVLFALTTWNHETGSGSSVRAPGIVFASGDNVAPDVVWVARDRLPNLLDDGGHLRAAPDLIVEVVSPGPANQQRDPEIKLNLYSRQGIREYWIVDWQDRNVQVFRRQGTALRIVETLVGGDVLTSPMLPGFACPVSTFWEAPT